MSMEYKPLSTSINEIRLLRQLPSRDGILSFGLENFPLSIVPPFSAFSYVWGDPNKTSRILVNNHNFEATENLVSALQTHVTNLLELRPVVDHPHIQAEYLWVDAICINQNNFRERSEQVQLMCDIYQKGIVCIYLNTTNRDAYRSAWITFSMINKKLDEGLPVELSEFNWIDMVQFFSKAWFHRMWMIQEFVMAESSPLLLFLGGHKSIKDSGLRDAAWELFQQIPSQLTAQERAALLSGIKQYMSLADIKDRIRDGQPCSFFTLLWIFRDRIATDPRDKKYSLLGLLQGKETSGEGDGAAMTQETRGLAIKELIIDYKASVEDIYASLVKAMVIGMGCLNVICGCQRPGKFVRSWVPNWSEPWSRTSLLANSLDITPEHFLKKKFKASGARSPDFEFSKSLRSIDVTGICSSTVSDLGACPPGQLDSYWAVEWFQNLDSRVLLQIGTIYGNNEFEDSLEEYILSICATDAEDEFNYAEALADDYFLFYAGASADWQNMVRKFRDKNSEEFHSDDYIVNIRIAQMVDGRKVFIGENGYCGLVPDHAERGDLVCVLFGCDVPVVLRKAVDHYIFMGECYVQGLMQGEAIEALERGDV